MLATAKAANAKRKLIDGIDCSYEEKLVKRLSELAYEIDKCTDDLADALKSVKKSLYPDICERSMAYKDKVVTAMAALRKAADEAESITAAKYWPYPVYADLLFGII